MKVLGWARLLLAAAPLLTGCGNFWQAPSGSNGSFALTNSGNITVSQGATTGNTATITVTPTNSFTGAVTLTCAIASAPSSATSPTTCSLSPTSVTISTTAQTSTLTATTSGTTTLGAYDITVTGVSGSVAETTTVCVEVGTGTCTATPSSSGNFYIMNADSIAGYSISNGVLNLITGSSYTVPGVLAIAIDPAGKYLWVASTTGIAPYTISSTGALTPGSVISAFSDPEVGALQVDPSGRWLLDASLSGNLFAFPITTLGTEDTSRSVQSNIFLASTTVQTGGIAVSPSGSSTPIIAVALGATYGTQVFSFNANNTALPIATPSGHTITPYGQSGVAAAVAVAIDPSNGFLYVGETDAFPSSLTGDSGALRVFTFTANSVTEISYSGTTPYASGGTTPHTILASSNGYVYVANWQGVSDGVITAFLLSASTPSLTLQSNTAATGETPDGMTVDSTGNFVLVVNKLGSPPLSTFTFDATTTGQLDPYSLTGSLGAGPVAIVAAP